MGLGKAASWRAIWALFALTLPFAPSSVAQVVTATLTGTVTDASGAVVPEATVVATETSTGVSRTTATGAEGVYTMPFLPPGTYRVEIQKGGFKTFTEGGLQLDVSSVGRVNATLTPGSQKETVQVTAEAPLLQAESADVSKNYDSQTATELPLPDRSAQSMAGLMAGVNLPSLYSSGSGILENGAFTYMFNANGQVLGANNTMVDGIDNMDMALGLTLYQPATEDVSEVHVTTNAYSAEFGKVGGAVVNIVTKGGTNQFHGSLFEFNKTAALGARNVFNQAPQPKAGLTNNDYGAAGGGPIKRNKTFFFASYEGRKYYSSSETTATTAQPAWLTGDFSAVPGLQLYDPHTGNQTNGSGRSPFPNNIVPQSEFSAVSQKLLKFIPAPNLVVAGAEPFTLNYIYSAPTDYNSNSFDGRVDHNFNDRMKLTVKFDTLLTHTYEGALYTGTGVGNDLISDGNTDTGAIDFTYLFHSNTIMEARVNVNRWVAHIKCTNTVTNAGLGIYDPNPDNISTQSLASISGIGIGGFGQSYECPTIDHDTVFPFSNTWTKSFGKHSLKWGGDFVRYRNDRFQVQGSGGFGGRGTFTFSPTITENYLGSGGSPLGLYGSTVNPFAAFLLGLPASIDRAQILLSPTMRQSHADGFIQDSYKVTPRLTLDIGLRYDWYEAAKVRYAGGASNYEPSTNSLIIAGYGNVSLSDGVNSKPGYLGPRLGIAYSLGRRTVVRAGYGISYWEQRFGWTGGTLNQQYPVIYNVQVGTTSQYVPAGTLGSIVPVTYLAVPSNGILSPAPNQAFYYMPSHYNLPAVYTWNFTLQRQITPTLAVDAGWVANLGRELPYAYNLNQGLPGAGPNAAILNVLYGRTASTTIRAYGANSNYNSLQVNVLKKFARGYHVGLAYTFSKSLDETGENGGFLNPNNFKQSWGPSNFDQTHMLTINHVYELPVGKGQPLLHENKIAGAILGGWQISGVFRYFTGLPFTAGAAATNANCASCSVVADITGTPVYPGLYGPGQQYLSPSAFALEKVGTRGNSGRDNLRGPGLTVYDANLVRKFHIHERVTAELRFEGTNVTNHPHWGNPSATVNTATFGQISTATNPRQAQVAMRVSF
ncbi:MAG TPA: carboxypeptidase regulatory-like domain-containing protein [Bryobacteraceae bacterium]|nr:carboxypeptidase regulatory-like domain-containing protein [Bryobacteraceae bacterium]